METAEHGYAPMSDDQALHAQKRRTTYYMLATVILALIAAGAIVAIVVVKSHSDSPGQSTLEDADSFDSVNVGHISDVFQADVTVTHQPAFTADAEVSPPYVAPIPTPTTRILSWYQDRANGVKDLTFHSQIWSNASDEFRISTDLTNMVQTVESTAANTCLLLSIDPEAGLETNFRAVARSMIGPITVQGRTCTQFNATRADGKTFFYSIDTTGSVCDIRVARTVYTMISYTPNAARPAYSQACRNSFNNVIAWATNGTTGLSRGASVQPLGVGTGGAVYSPNSIWNPWDDAKSIWGDVTQWAGGVYNWAKANYCQLCAPIMDQVIDKGSELGSDFICDAATEGAASDFCGELAQDAVQAGCDVLDCAKKICSAIGGGSC